MKKIILALMFAMFTQLHALNEGSAIPSDHKTLVDNVLDDLHFEDASDEARITIYKELKPFLKEGWYSHWTSNRTGSDSKIADAQTMYTDIMLYNNERVTNVTLIYFRQFNQAYIGVKEFVATTDKRALERFRKNKNDTKLKKLNETDNYAVFNKKGFMGYETSYINGTNAMMVYETSNYLNVYPKNVTNTIPNDEGSNGTLDKKIPSTTTTPSSLDKNPTNTLDNQEKDLTLIPKS
ncbi:MAG: hypothetical protein KU28_08080 [Sulfurovum sp. PC08-66]|nr:MAG: hypothetical protein KU28_08080 [Sulfurovum sp. PC08-66]